MITHKQNGVHSERCCQEVDYQLAQLRKVNKQLVEALELLTEILDGPTVDTVGDNPGILEAMEKARAALSAAKEASDE